MQRYLIAPLAKTRSLLSVTGADAAHFLQGLVSNNVLPTSHASSDRKNGEAHGIYAGFFAANGRLLQDTFVLPSASSSASSNTDYIIDYPKQVTAPLLPSYIKRFILRSKVKSKSLDDSLSAWGVFRHPLAQKFAMGDNATSIEDELSALANEHHGTWWRDTRATGMGYRLLLPPTYDVTSRCPSVFGPEPSLSLSVADTSFESADTSLHSLLRAIVNVPEMPMELKQNVAIPLESNLDVMGGSESAAIT